jgi:hypothetical protein
MLDHFGKVDLEALVASEGGPHISFYMPTHATVAELEQDPLRLKNLAHEAQKQLTKNWMEVTEARDFLAPVAALVHDDSFWSQRQHGLAIFLSKNEFRVFRLGAALEEKLSISRSYMIRPLIRVLQSDVSGFVLALSANKRIWNHH